MQKFTNSIIYCFIFLSYITYAIFCPLLLFFVLINIINRTETVSSIIRKWDVELNEDLAEFQLQAQKVAIWDNQLRENQNVRE